MLESNTRTEGGQGTAPRLGLVDSHLHLDLYPSESLTAILERARTRGVVRLLTVSVDEASAERNVFIAENHPEVVAAVGLHPLRVTEEHGDTHYAALLALTSHPKVVAIGEAGLDYVDASHSRVLQEYWLRRQIRLSAASGLPLIIHCRSAVEDLVKIIDEEGGLPNSGVVHYFVGEWEEAHAYLDRGLFISVGRPLSRPGMESLAEVVRAMPIERLLIETDSYPLPGRTTEPADVNEVAEAVARVRGLSWTEVADVTTDNFLRLFRKAAYQ